MRITFVIIASLVGLSSFAQKKIVREIIDVHLHARSYDSYGNPPAPNPLTGKSATWKTNGEVVSMTLDSLKKYNVVMAVTSGSLNRINDFSIVDTARFIPSLDFPDDENNNLPDTATFIQLIRDKKFLVFGELALQYAGKLLTDPELEPYLSICERMDIPVALHTGLGAPGSPYNCCPNFRTHLGNPQLIEEVLVKHPNLKIQLMHMGYPYLAETKAIMYVYPQVYADIALIDWLFPDAEFQSYLKSMMDAGYGRRIMYGSDQMGWPDAIPLSIKNIEKVPFLSEAQKQDIFYNNAKRFYNLK